MRCDHVGDDGDIGGMRCAQSIQNEVICQCMHTDEYLALMFAHQPLERTTDDWPEGGGHETSLRLTIAESENCSAKLRHFLQPRIDIHQMVEGLWSILLDEIHHLRAHLIAILGVDGLDDGFGGSAMATAGIREEECYYWFFVCHRPLFQAAGEFYLA